MSIPKPAVGAFFILIFCLFSLPVGNVRADAAWTLHVIDNSHDGADGIRMKDVNGDGLLDLATSFEEGGISKIFIHPGPSNVEGTWQSVVVDTRGGQEDAVFADLDGNGQQDMISSRQNWGELDISWAPDDPAEYMDESAWISEEIPAAHDQSQWIYAVPYQVDGENGIDIVAGASNTGYPSQLVWFESPADPRVIDDWVMHKIDDTIWTMSMFMTDMDGDGDADLVTSDRATARWLENPGTGSIAQESEWESHTIVSVDSRFMDMADFNGDGLTDIINVMASTDKVKVSLRLNSTGESWNSDTVIDYTEPSAIPKSVKLADINNDGRKDLALTSEQSFSGNGVYWLSYSNSIFDTMWDFHEISGLGGSTGAKFDDIHLYDVDADGDLDLFTTEENQNLGIIWYENPFGPGIYANRSSGSSLLGTVGVPAPGCYQSTPGNKPPELYGVQAQSSTSMLLQWAAADGPFDRYAIEYGTQPGVYEYGAASIGDKDTRAYVVKNLDPGKKYYFRVRAGNGCATGPWSNILSARTLGGVNTSIETPTPSPASEGIPIGGQEGEMQGESQLSVEAVPSPDPFPTEAEDKGVLTTLRNWLSQSGSQVLQTIRSWLQALVDEG